MTSGLWLLIAPLAAALLIVLYTGWQAFKEIRLFAQRLKSLQQKITETKEDVKTLMADIQYSKAKAIEQAEHAQALISNSKETYDNLKNIVGAVRDLDTTPARQAITYFKQRREDHRLAETMRYMKGKARKINTKLDQNEISQLPAMLGVILSVTALFFALRRSI